MKKINCPFCGKELVVLNDITIGTCYKYCYEFWCDECNADITIQTDVSSEKLMKQSKE